MPKYYCDYCDTYLKHVTQTERKKHFQGKRHTENVREYYRNFMVEQAQKSIDQRTPAYQHREVSFAPYPIGGPRFVNPNIAPPRLGVPIVPPPWAFTFPVGVPPFAPPNPAAMTALMTLRPPFGIPPPAVPKPE